MMFMLWVIVAIQYMLVLMQGWFVYLTPTAWFPWVCIAINIFAAISGTNSIRVFRIRQRDDELLLNPSIIPPPGE